ncbi:hypothetical protein [Rasiella sp. SM2506]|uniref:hypothetical protein n=1 Tax=Rasiella sp. SM2506 TaxID=3423914 RepID=UPI003D78EBEC
MKTIVSLLCIALLSTVAVNAQVQKDVQKKTTTKKVRVTDNNQITTKTVEDIDSEIDVIMVDDNNMEDQAKKVTKLNADRTEVVGENNAENVTNKMEVAQKMKVQQMNLEKSKQMQMELAQKEKMALDAIKKKMMADLEKRRMELQARPKGMSKLKKDPDGDGIN